MKKIFKRGIATCAAICTMLCTVAFSVSALSAHYHTPAKTFVKDRSSLPQWSYTVHANTRPSTGTGGARVIVETTNGGYVDSKDFPYYTNASDLVTTIPVNSTYYYFVQPCVNGQWIEGNLYLS